MDVAVQAGGAMTVRHWTTTQLRAWIARLILLMAASAPWAAATVAPTMLAPDMVVAEDDAGGAAELMLRMAKIVGEVQLVPLATVRYYALDFAQNAKKSGNDDTDKIVEVMSTPAT